MPILSVIIPVYNVEKYLKQCLDSVLNQTLNDIEIIIINDGSTDKSSKIINEYKENKNVKIIHKDNEGVAFARNIGIDNSIGKYITFVDSDDYLELDMYKHMVDVAIRENADIVQCGIELISEDGTNHIGYVKNNEEILNNIEATKEFLRLKIPGYSVNSIYLRELFIRNNIKYSNSFCYEDMQVILLSLLNCNKIVKINECFYKYRQINTSLSHKLTKNHVKAYINQMKVWLEICNEYNCIELREDIELFNLLTYLNALNWYIRCYDFDRKKVYENYNIYFNDVEPKVSYIKILRSKNIKKGVKFIYFLWRLKLYDIFMKYEIL